MATDESSSRVRPAWPPTIPSPTTRSVYEQVADLLLQEGWAKGADRDRKGRYSLREAVDEVVRGSGLPLGDQLGRTARCSNHLRRLAGTTNLDAWNDAPERTQGHVFELLQAAARLHTTD